MGLSLDFLALSLGNAAMLIIGAMVWRRNTASGSARIFFLATIAFSVWLTINYYSIQSFDLNVLDILMRFSYVSGVWLMVVAWYFCYQFPIERKPSVSVRLSALAILFLGSLFSYSSLVVENVTYRNSVVFMEAGSLYALYGVLLGALGVGAMVALWRNYGESDLLRRNQIRYVAFGIGISTVISITFNVVLVPILGTSWGSVTANVLVIVPLMIFLGYALIRHRYVEVHRILSWVTTYAICIALVAIWLIFIESLFPKIYPNSLIAQHIGIAVAASVAIFAFQPVAHWIRHRANQLFSVDWYDSQDFLNTMGSMLAGERQLEPLLKKSLDSICSVMQVTAGELVIVDEAGEYKKVSYGDSYIAAEHIELPEGHDIILVDELSSDDPVVKRFNKQGWRIGVPLETRGRRVGYLFLAIKKQGDIFMSRDIRVLEILSSQLAVAIVSAQAYDQINTFNKTLRQQVSEATVNLRKANDQLKVEDQMKTEFIILTSHNLRTPLSIIKGYMSLLEDTKLNENQTKLLASMKDGAARLSQFIEDLLTIDSIVAGHQLVLQPMKATDVLAPLIEEASANAKDGSVTFIADVAAIRDVTIDANALRLSGAIRNLIDNAFKFSANSTVTLTATVKGKHLHIIVADTGIGISDVELPHLFSRFHRATSALQYDYDGKGIGLYLTRLVIKEHGGTIVAHSKMGEGSQFVIELPIQS